MKTDHEMVSEKLISMGWNVFGQTKNKKANGIDLIATKNDTFLSIEVKTARYSQRVWRIQILKSQRTVDLLAVVFPDKEHVFFLPMSLAIKSCSKDGTICLGKLGDIL